MDKAEFHRKQMHSCDASTMLLLLLLLYRLYVRSALALFRTRKYIRSAFQLFFF